MSENKFLGSQKQNKIELFHTLGSTSKFLVSGAASVVLLTSSGRESWIPTYYITGAIFNGVLSKILKNYIREPRPKGSKRGGYGMPSSHTQSFFYFLTAVALNSNRILSRRQGSILTLLLGSYALIASYWRVHTGIHSVAQVAVGAVLGVLTGLLTWSYEANIIGAKAAMKLPDTVPVVLKIVVISLAALVVGKKEIKGFIKTVKGGQAKLN
jgi:membrane-associated phospholipid phosphatase